MGRSPSITANDDEEMRFSAGASPELHNSCIGGTCFECIKTAGALIGISGEKMQHTSSGKRTSNCPPTMKFSFVIQGSISYLNPLILDGHSDSYLTSSLLVSCHVILLMSHEVIKIGDYHQHHNPPIITHCRK